MSQYISNTPKSAHCPQIVAYSSPLLLGKVLMFDYRLAAVVASVAVPQMVGVGNTLPTSLLQPRPSACSAHSTGHTPTYYTGLAFPFSNPAPNPHMLPQVRSLALSPDGKHIALGGTGGSVFVAVLPEEAAGSTEPPPVTKPGQPAAPPKKKRAPKVGGICGGFACFVCVGGSNVWPSACAGVCA